MKVLNVIDSDSRKPVPYNIRDGRIVILSSGIHNKLEVISETEAGEVVSHILNHQKTYSY